MAHNDRPAESSTPPSEQKRNASRPALELVKGQGGETPQDKPAHIPGPDGWPEGYYRNQNGLYYRAPVKDGEEGKPPIRLGPPIELLGEARDSQSGNWGLLLRFLDPDGIEHDFILDRAKLAGEPSAWIGELMASGWRADGRRGNRLLLADCFTRCASQVRIRTVDKAGWVEDGQAFVLPTETLGNGAEKYLLAPRPAKNIFSRGGSFEGWASTVGQWAVGNYLLFFAVCAALAGSLLKILGLESGGFHFSGPTSSGKTTVLKAASSVWGQPDEFGLTWNSTSSGLEGRAALHSDTLLSLDEIGQAPERALRDSAYLLANETGKARARQDGTGRPPAQWRVMIQSSGECFFAESLKMAGFPIKGGQAVRVIDLPADAGVGLGVFQCLHEFAGPAALAEAIKKAARENYGHAGPEFVRSLLLLPKPDREKTVAGIFKKKVETLTPPGAAPEVARAVRRFALVATAGELASRWGFFEGLAPDGGESLLAAAACRDAWLAARGGAGSLAEVQAKERLFDFLGAHGGRFQDRKPGGDDRPVLNRAGFRETLNKATEYFIFPDVFQHEICDGLNHSQVAGALAEAGILKRGDGRHLTDKVVLPGLGRRRVFVVRLFGGDN